MPQFISFRTIVFDQPRHARGFFEALVVDNLDLGRPDKTELIFTSHRVHRGRPGIADRDREQSALDEAFPYRVRDGVRAVP